MRLTTGNNGAQSTPSAPVIDVHVHLFGANERHSGCVISDPMRRHLAYQGLKWLLGLRQRDIDSGKADAVQAERIIAMAEAAEGVDKVVLLALDGVFLPGRPEMDRRRTPLYVPNNYLFDICSRSPALLPGASVHPDRPNAVDVLGEVIDRGAALLKWLPPAQLIDPSCRRYIPFYEKLADASVPLLCHTSAERTFPNTARHLEDPQLLQLPLEVGVTVIAAHCGTAILGQPRTDYVEGLVQLMSRFENLYADNAAMCSPGRGHHWGRVLRQPLLLSRMVHGSDYPIPCWPQIYAGQLGWLATRELSAQRNPLARDCATKRALGVPDDVFRRAHGLVRER